MFNLMPDFDCDGISASRSFHKARLIKLHKKALELCRSFDGFGFHATFASGNESPRASPPLSSLRKILISELQLGKRHVGRVLYGTLCTTPMRFTAIHTLLEDEAGNAIRLSMYNAVTSKTNISAIQALYPEGMKLAIKEPYFKQFHDLGVGLRVDNPADIVAVDPGGDSELQEEAASTAHAVELRRKTGNSFFAAEQWTRAIDMYTRCVDACESSTDVEPRVRMFALSNRAEAWLRLHLHENALCDVVKALIMDPTHDKSMLRKGKALCGLQCFGEAITCFEALLKQLRDRKSRASPIQRKEVMEALREARTFDQQSRLGDYHSSVFLNYSDAAPPKCSEFVGPVEIRQMEGDKRSVGRGLFVTRDVQEGELLLVSNALAVARGEDAELGTVEGPDEMHDSVRDDLITKVMQVAMASPRKLLQLYSLSDGTNHPPVPAMTLFKPPEGMEAARLTSVQEGQLPEIDVARIHRIVRTNALQSRGAGGVKFLQSATRMWVLPSFLNHSCIPNAHFLQIGDAMFVRAFRDISAGSEVTAAYFDILQPLQERDRILNGMGFRCCCPRCSFERCLVAQFPTLKWIAALKTSIDHNRSLINGHPEDATIVAGLNEILQAMKPQDGKRKDWVQASFLQCYWSTQSMKGTQSLSFLFNLTFNIVPSELLLAAVMKAVQYRASGDTRCIKRWNDLAVRICKCIFGPQQPAIYNALMEQVLSDAERDLLSAS